ncbi:hypothetical protein [Flavivirga spongiicola]|uniref:LIVCS family branched-chain amino acid:cation transporter n=1 Tax=Flavivirga spongiicola TaxID=421621 RepID=A0ABU7XWD5_9FLAO|nr:hypothetical protein [Flavivirga sp. MEBiC05379]MDO5980099.1 hypothetical protein [Flavivirga sp. MEBiC05379]
MDIYKVSSKIALVSFSIGTILFVLQVFIKGINAVTMIGYYYVGLAIIINSLVFIMLLSLLFINKNKRETIQSIGIILFNIPIAFLYYSIVIHKLI